jgi:hypothetical protein
MKTKRQFWVELGFLPFEASAFKNITYEAIRDTPYLAQMIKERVDRLNRAINDGLSIRQYYFRVRKKYVDLELITPLTPLNNNDAGRSKAFKLFNYYKDKYGIRDRNGKLIETPRKKTKVKMRKITGDVGKDQKIAKHQEQINMLRGRMRFNLSESQRQSYQTRINIQQNAIDDLKG